TETGATKLDTGARHVGLSRTQIGLSYAAEMDGGSN
ncbi:hypothetical protein A2U01_0043619, partial [Trifolium medium]|nr:hypothetical protein [Trifolium medium]